MGSAGQNARPSKKNVPDLQLESDLILKKFTVPIMIAAGYFLVIVSITMSFII